MLSEKDRAVVYSMCRTGMSIDTLKLSFPQFNNEDIESIYDEYNNEATVISEDINISCNCS